jgi:hypothetical protein
LKVGDDHFEMTAISAFAGRDSVRVVEDRHAGHPSLAFGKGARLAPVWFPGG